MPATDEPTLNEALGVEPRALAGLDQPLWLQNSTYPAALDRQLVAAALEPGVLGLTELAVSQRGAGANMSVDVAAGRVVVPLTDAPNLGSALCRSTAVNNLTVSGAPAAGTSRIDLVIARVYDASIIGGSINGWQLEIVTGTAASSPAAPALPASSIELARLAIASGQASIQTANITDRRIIPGVWRNYSPNWFTASGGQPSVGNGSIFGRYMVRGKLCNVVIRVNYGSTTGGGNNYHRYSLPVPALFPFSSTVLGVGQLYCPTMGGLGFFGIAALWDANAIGVQFPVSPTNLLTNWQQMTDGSNTPATGVPNVSPSWNIQNGGFTWIAAAYEMA